MATADLITQLKQDFDDVYAAGKAAGGGSGDYDQGYEDGKNSVAQIERYLGSGSFVGLGIFQNKEVELYFDLMSSFQSLFYCQNELYKNTTLEHLTINALKSIVNMGQVLRCFNTTADKVLKRLTLNFSTQKATSFYRSFDYCQALETIDGEPLDFSSAKNADEISYMFNQCVALTNIRVVANSIKFNISFSHSSKLSTDTIQSIIDGLADLTDGTAQTLTLHATVGGKLTDEQKATITAKNWTLVY